MTVTLAPWTINVATRKVDQQAPPAATEPYGGRYNADEDAMQSLTEWSTETNIPVSKELLAEVYASRLINIEAATAQIPAHVYSYLISGGAATPPVEGTMFLEVIAGIDIANSSQMLPETLPAPGEGVSSLSQVDMSRLMRFHKFYSVVHESQLPSPGTLITVAYLDDDPRTTGVVINTLSPAVSMSEGEVSGTAQPPSAAVVNATAAKEIKDILSSEQYPRRIVCLGDSITAVCSHRHTDARTAAKLCGYSLTIKNLMKKADKNAPGEVYKLGYSGKQTGNILHGKERRGSELNVGISMKQIDGVKSTGGLKVALRLKPTDIIILAGVNDIASAVSAEKTIDNLREMYGQCKKAGIRVIAVTVIPWGSHQPSNFGKNGKRVKSSVWYPRYEKINEFIRNSVTNGLSDVVVDTVPKMGDASQTPVALKKIFQQPKPKNPKHRWDKLHPNKRGQKFLGELIFNIAIKPIIDQRKSAETAKKVLASEATKIKDKSKELTASSK